VLPSKRNSLKNCGVLGNKCYKKWVEREGVIEKGTFWKCLSTRKVLRSEEWMFWMCLRVQKRAVSETNADEKINLLSGFAIAMLWLKNNSSHTQHKKKRKYWKILAVLLFFCLQAGPHESSQYCTNTYAMLLTATCSSSWEMFWKNKCKIKKIKKGQCSRGFAMGLQSGSRMQAPTLEEVCEMAVN